MYDAIANARAIVPALRATTGDSERLRHVSPAAIRLLHESGLTRMLAPKRYGGYELAPRLHVLSCAETALGCPSASWIMMVCGAHTFIVGRFPRQCQDEIFGDDPGVLIPGTPSGQGSCVRHGDGWLLNGRWQFCSGVDHGKWILVGARGVVNSRGEPCPDMQLVMPAGDLEIDDTWHVLGMRGTGSKDIVAKDVFIPGHRGVPVPEAFFGTVPGVDIPLYRLPIAATLATMLTGTILGIAERGLGHFIEATRVRQDIYVGGAKAAKVSLQMRVAEATGEIEVARMLVERACALLDEAMTHEAPMDTESRSRVRWNAAYANELCRRATERLYAAAGAHATYDGNEIQRFFRDINIGTHHAILDFDQFAEVRGQLLLGIEPAYAMI
ncbi:MAG: hypothetical protein HY749_10480 [Gammaproteobacteria bacterium]|nr:hypothetical protein [Gammaproteobacteria bacterium]